MIPRLQRVLVLRTGRTITRGDSWYCLYPAHSNVAKGIKAISVCETSLVTAVDINGAADFVSQEKRRSLPVEPLL
jgi:hypothetical protein